MESHLTSLRGSVWSHFLISLFNCLNILENKLVRIKIICPGWWIQKHTEKNIPWLTENTFLFHTGLLLLEYLHSYHSTKKLTIFSSTPTKLWEIYTLNLKTLKQYFHLHPSQEHQWPYSFTTQALPSFSFWCRRLYGRAGNFHQGTNPTCHLSTTFVPQSSSHATTGTRAEEGVAHCRLCL